MALTVRPTSAPDLDRLQEIERLAGERFRQVGLPEVAEDDPPSLAVLDAYASDGRSWVAVDEDDRPIGYVLVDVVDQSAHIEQVTVHPDQQGRGVGRALVERVARWALARGARAVTLTTFRQVRGTSRSTATSASGRSARTISAPSSERCEPPRQPTDSTPSGGSACASTSEPRTPKVGRPCSRP